MKYFFSALLSFLVSVANIFLAPVNTIISTYFPTTSNLISQFTNIVNTYIGGGVAYFLSILPSGARTLFIFYIDCLIAFYTISFIVHGIIKVIEIIKAVKIW